jgi:hypothetical protein
MQFAMFNKNISIIGAAFLITYFGSGPLSLDEFVNKYSISIGRNKSKIKGGSFAAHK